MFEKGSRILFQGDSITDCNRDREPNITSILIGVNDTWYQQDNQYGADILSMRHG